MADPWSVTVAALMGATRSRAPSQARPLGAHEAGHYADLLGLIERGVTSPAELADALGTHPATLHGQLRRLAGRGILKRAARGQWQRIEHTNP